MVFSGAIGQTNYSRDLIQAIPGAIEGMGDYQGVPYMHSAAGVAGVYTVTPPATVDANTTYSVSVNGFVASFATGGSTTTAQLGAGLFAALRANAQIFRLADITLNASTGVVTLTSVLLNTALTITSPTNASTTNDLTIATGTAPGTNGAVIPYGRFVGTLASYVADPLSGFMPAALINHASNFTVRGITLKDMRERTGIFEAAVEGYPFGTVMNVIERCANLRGVWCEAVESNITPANSVYIAIGAGNEGKVTSTSSGNVDISARARFVSNAVVANGKTLVLVYFNR